MTQSATLSAVPLGAARPSPSPRPAAAPDAGADRRALAVLVAIAAVVFVAATALRLRGMPAGDEPHYLIITQAMLKYGTVDPTPAYEHLDYWSYFPHPIDAHLVPAANGMMVPLHGFGGPLLWLVPFMLFGRPGAHLVMLTVSLLTVVNIYRLQRELGITRDYARFVTLLYILGTPLYVYASMLFIEPIGALLVIYAVRVILARRPAPARLVLASAGLGYLPWVHGRFTAFTVILGGLLVATIVARTGRGSAWPYVQGVLPLAVLLAGIEVVTFTRYGTLNPAPGNAALGEGVFQLSPHLGLMFLALDARAGLLSNFPVFVLAAAGVLLSARRSPLRVHVVLLAAVVPYLLAISTFPNWGAGSSPPARLLTVTLPVLAYYLAVALQRLHRRLVNSLAVGAAAASFLVAFGSDLHPADRFTAIGGAVPLARLALLTGLPLDRIMPAAASGREVGAGQWPLFLAWSVAVAAIVGWLWVAGRRAPAERIPADVPVRTRSCTTA